MEKHQRSVTPQCSFYGRFKKSITFSNPPSVNYPNSPEYPKASTKPVPIEFDHSVLSKINKNRPVFVGLKDKVESEKKREQQQAGGNNQFSDYIKRAKRKMRRNRTVVASDGGGSGKGVSRLESINKNMSAYMDRAKVKMKTSSVVGNGKKPD